PDNSAGVLLRLPFELARFDQVHEVDIQVSQNLIGHLHGEETLSFQYVMKVGLAQAGNPGQTTLGGLPTADAMPQVIHEALLKILWVARTPKTVGLQKDTLSMQWNRSNTVGLASGSCCYCQGGGQRLVYKNHYAPCACVFRAVFRTCLNRFRECTISEGMSGTVTWEFCAGFSAG